MDLIIQILSSNLLTNILLLIIIFTFFLHNISLVETVQKQTKLLVDTHLLLHTISLQNASEDDEKNKILLEYEESLKKEALKKKLFNLKS